MCSLVAGTLEGTHPVRCGRPPHSGCPLVVHLAEPSYSAEDRIAVRQAEEADKAQGRAALLLVRKQSTDLRGLAGNARQPSVRAGVARPVAQRPPVPHHTSFHSSRVLSTGLRVQLVCLSSSHCALLPSLRRSHRAGNTTKLSCNRT